jgi:Fic family protein
MPMRATKAPQFPPSLADIQFKALPLAAIRRKPARTEVTDRIRCEFVEMRGFSPTVEQAARLFQVSREECVYILKTLVEEGFLKQTPDGRYRLPSQQ